MHDQTAHAPVWASYIPFAIIPVVLLLRARRMTQLRAFKPGRLWIGPALYSLVVAVLFATKPPHGLGWGLCALALLVGTALGWQRGKTVRLQVDAATGTLRQRGSLAGIAFLLVLIAVKTGARELGTRLGFDVALASDAMALLVLGMIAAMRVEMYLRAKTLLATV